MKIAKRICWIVIWKSWWKRYILFSSNRRRDNS